MKNSLDLLAIEYFNNEHNAYAKLPISQLPISYKRVLLLEIMKLGNLKMVQKKLKLCVNAFAAPDYQARIPLYDSCRNYKFTVDDDTKLKLKQIKIEKEMKMKKKKIVKTQSTDFDIRVKIRPPSHRSSHCIKNSFDRITVYKLTDEQIPENKGDIKVEFC